MKKGFQILNEFYIRIIAILTMTLDHIGLFLIMFCSESAFSNPMYLTGYIFRCVGRISLPLFLLMLVEGIRHTRNGLKYLLRLGVMMFAIMVFEAIVYHLYTADIEAATSPFIDLFVIGSALYLINRKDKYSWLSLIPIAYCLMCGVVQIYERTPINGLTHEVLWLPFYLRTAYSFFSLLLGLGFYYAYELVNHSLKKKYSFEEENMKEIRESPYFRSLVSINMIIVLIVVNIVIYITGAYLTIDGFHSFNIYSYEIQNWSLLTIPFILMYNGLRGYDKRWFRICSYAYFPVHIIIIFGIFYLIYML